MEERDRTTMPTMDLDASVRAICGRDPRFRPEAYHFVLDGLDFTLRRGSGPAGGTPAPALEAARPGAGRTAKGGPVPWNVTGRDLLEGIRDLALERFGALAPEVLRHWGITRTDDVGAIVFNMVEGGLLQRTSSDSPADYRGVFDLEASLDREFAERLRRDPVRGPVPPGG